MYLFRVGNVVVHCLITYFLLPFSGLSILFVCLSFFCLSATLVHCAQTAEDIDTILFVVVVSSHFADNKFFTNIIARYVSLF